MVRTTGEVITADCLPETCRKQDSAPTWHRAGPAELIPQLSAPDPEPAVEDAIDNEFPSVAALTQRLLADESNNVYREIGAHVDQVVLEMVMKHVGGNQQAAAEYLGISRMTLRSKLRALGMLSEKST